MKVLSFFTGIGGFDLGFEQAGMECIGQIERDKTCQLVLNAHWPNVTKGNDVTTYKHTGPIPDVICAEHGGAVALRGRAEGTALEIGDYKAFALRASQGGGDKPMMMAAMGVRRLTPRECERLQGFSDDFTRWDANGVEISDSQRYRMLGNAVTVSVAKWIGKQIMAVEAKGKK